MDVQQQITVRSSRQSSQLWSIKYVLIDTR